MKITCNDGIVRRFNPAKHLWRDRIYPFIRESECTHCGETFGIHTTENLKPVWKAHVCKIHDICL